MCLWVFLSEMLWHSVTGLIISRDSAHCTLQLLKLPVRNASFVAMVAQVLKQCKVLLLQTCLWSSGMMEVREHFADIRDAVGCRCCYDLHGSYLHAVLQRKLTSFRASLACCLIFHSEAK